MPRAAALLLALALLAPPQARAQEDLSATLAERGLAATARLLDAKADPTASDRFALGGVHFLAGVERALQLRYRVELSEGLAVMSGLPLLRLPIPENPQPAPFEPAMIEALFVQVEADMARAIEALAPLSGEEELELAVNLGDLWFDIDADGARAPGEGLMDVAGLVLSGGFGSAPAPFEVRFDTADAAWLRAYAHLLSGVSEGVLALDPAGAVARVTEARAGFEALGRPEAFALDAQFGDWVDLAAIFVGAIEGQPDPARTRALRDHLLAMAEDSRLFWTLVSRESDNDREWIPNKRQQSATGLPFPPETGAQWLRVLDDAEAVLRGERLIPFWRVGRGAGLDLHALLEDPPEVDLAGAIQGALFLPYLRQGPLADARNLALFDALVGGQGVLYAVVLN